MSIFIGVLGSSFGGIVLVSSAAALFGGVVGVVVVVLVVVVLVVVSRLDLRSNEGAVCLSFFTRYFSGEKSREE